MGPAFCDENNLSMPMGSKITEDMDCEDVSCAGNYNVYNKQKT